MSDSSDSSITTFIGVGTPGTSDWGPLVVLSDGSQFPSPVIVWAYIGGLSVTLELVVEEGQPILDNILIERGDDRGPLTSSSIAGIPIDEVVRQAVAGVRHLKDRTGRNPATGEESAPRGKVGWLVTESLLQQVAAVIRSDPFSRPNKAVAEHFSVSSRTASRWIKLAQQYIENNEGSES